MSKRSKRLRNAPPRLMQIERLSHEGRGIAKVDDKTTFVFNALEGETVKAQYTLCRSKFDEAKAVEIIEASNDRTEPACDYFGICGGCQLQHMHHSKQISIKESALKDLIKHVAGIEFNEWMPAILGDTLGYRRKARLGVRQVDKKGDTLVGFRERAGRYLTDMNHCKVLVPEVGEKIPEIRAMLTTLEARAQIAQIEIAQGDDATALVLRNLVTLTDQDIKTIKQFAEQHHYKIYLQPKGPETIYPIYPENADTLMHYQLDNCQFSFSPTGFIQVNAKVNNQMIAKVMQLLELNKNDRALDLFCGLGNFSLPLAKRCIDVVGIEASDESVSLARKNAAQNTISNAAFISANLFEDIDHLEITRQHFDKIILDPPRHGAEHVLKYLPHWQPSHIVYISCNPATFARDAKIIAEHDYTLDKLGIMDMFAHTEHTEVISLFKRR